MEPISGLVAAPLQPIAPGVTAAPDAAATQRFAGLMRPPEAEAAATAVAGAPAAADPAAGTYAIDPAKGPASPGDRILSGMQNVSEEFRGTWTRAYQMLRSDNPQLGMKETLDLQLGIADVSIQSSMVTNFVNRATQNFDQLARMQ